MTQALYGADAIAAVEAIEGPLTPTQKRIVELEGYSHTPYQDTKGMAIGVGQTGKYANMTFKETVDDIEMRTKRRIPELDSLPDPVQTELIQAEFRGDLGQSPKTVALINEGNYAAAAQEFLDNNEYRTTQYAGIRTRMEDVANAIGSLAGTNAQEVPEDVASTPAPKDISTQKQEQLQEVSTAKQEAVASKSSTKQYVLDGLTETQANALNQSLGAYTASARTPQEANMLASEWREAQRQAKAIDYRNKVRTGTDINPDVIFQDLDNPFSYAGNTALSTINTAAKVIGGLVSAPATVMGSLGMQGVGDEDIRMYEAVTNKMQLGSKFSKEEWEWMHKKHPTEDTLMFNRIDEAMQNLDFADIVNDSSDILGKYINTELTDEFVEEAAGIFNATMSGEQDVWDLAKDTAGLLLENPGALGQTTIESLPYMIASAYNLPLTVLSSFSANQTEALEAYEEKNGVKATGKDLATLTGATLAQSVVDHLGDRVATGGAKNIRKSLDVLLGKEATKKIAGKSGVKLVGDVVEGGVGEFIAEGGAELLGQYAVDQDVSELDYGQAFAGGLLGLGSGAATAGAVNAPQTAKAALESDTVKSATKAAKTASSKLSSAAKAGKETVSKAKGDTPKQEAKTAEDTKPLDTRLTEAFKEADATPQNAQDIEKEVRAEYNELKEQAKDVVSRIQSGGEVTTADQKTIEDFQAAQAVIRSRNKEVAARKASQQATLLATATTNNPKVQEAVQDTLGSIDLDPEAVTAEQATGILENTNLDLSTEQRSKLEHHVALRKNLADVSKEVTEGGNGNVGINQYVEQVGAALEIGDVATATTALEGLKSWHQRHAAKYESNVHNGKPMTPSLRKQVGKEVAAMDAAIQKLENDILYVDAPTQVEQAEVPVTGPEGQTVVDAEGNPVTADTIVTVPVTEQAQAAEQQATEAVAEEAVVAKDAQVESVVNTDEVTAELKEVFQKLDTDPAQVDQVVNEILDLNAQGVTFDSAIKSLRDQYGETTTKAAEEALGKLFPSTVDSLAGRITTPAEGQVKVPVIPADAPLKEKKAAVRAYNWITAYFQPKKSKGNILQKTPDLLTGPMGTSVANYLGRDLTNEEAALIEDVQSRHGAFVKSFDKLFNQNEAKKNYRDSDPQLFLADFDEQNIRDAYWVALYNWLATRSSDTMFNNDSTINTMLGRDSDAYVNAKMRYKLGKVGVGRNTLANTLGKDVMKLLHIQPTDQAFHHLESKLNNSVGLFALNVLKDMGTFEPVTEISAIELAELNPSKAKEVEKYHSYHKKAAAYRKKHRSLKGFKLTKPTIGEDKNSYYRIKTVQLEGKTRPAKTIRVISEKFKAANNSQTDTSERMWENAFGNLTSKKAPSFSPVKRVAKTVKNSDQKITKAERDIIKKHQNRKHFVRDDEWAGFSALGFDNMAKILGFTSVDDVHVSQRESQDNINHNIERELDNFQEFVHMRDEVGKEHFYFSHSKWTNGRYGIEENLVNPQGIKSHRAFIGQEGWVTTINPKEDNIWFWASMLEPLDIASPKDINEDQQAVIDEMKEYLNTYEFTPEAADKIATLISTGNGMGHKAESFTALMNLAKYQLAEEKGETFRTDMSIEIDGKTNGVILSMMQYADGENVQDLLSKLMKGGIYSNSYNNFNDFKDDGNKDAYEEIADTWMKALKAISDSGTVTPSAFIGAQYIFGLIDINVEETGGKREIVANTKGERNLAKNPLMVSNYGSGDLAVQDALAESFIERVYASLTEDPSPENYARVAGSVNAIVPGAMPSTTDAPLEVEIAPNNVETLKEFIATKFGEPVTEAINNQYAHTKAGQKAVNGGLELMYRMHNAVRNDMIAKATAEGIANGTIVEGVTSLSKEKLAAIEEEIKVMMPQMKTYYSKANTNHDYNMDMSGERTATRRDSGIYRVEAKYTENSSVVLGVTDVKVPSSPGVAGGVTSIHSLDALIMSKAYEGDVDVIGVHDAILVGVGDAQKGGEILNSATYEAMDSMNISFEVWRAFAQAHKAFNAYRARPDVDTKVIDKDFYNANGKQLKYRSPNAGQSGKTVTGKAAASAHMNDLRDTVKRVSKLKGELLATPDLIVHQYADILGATGVTFNETKVAEDLTEVQVANAGSKAVRSVEEVFHEAMYKANVPSDSLGSQEVDATTSPTQYDTEEIVDATNVSSVFDNLPNTGGKQENEAHRNLLRERVSHFGTFLMEPFRIHMRTKEDAPNYGVMTDSDIYMTNMAEGAPVTSSMLARGIQMSNEEVMAHELNHLVYLEGFKEDSQERRMVERMYLAAREQLDHTVFLNNPATASEAEIEGAKATFNHLFYEKKGHALAEFAAFGTTNERMMHALENVSVRPSKVFKGTIGEILRNILSTIVDALSNRVLNLKGLTSDRKLVKLLDNMHRVNAKKRLGFIQKAEDLAALAQGVTRLPATIVAAAVKKALTSDVFLNNKYAVISAPAKVLKNINDPKATAVMRKGFNAVRDAIVGTNNGFLATTFDEVIGRTEGNAQVRDLARASNLQLDQERKHVKTAMAQNIQNSFLTKMSEQDWIAVTKVFLKSDLTTLLSLGADTIQELLRSNAARENMISQLENRLVGDPNANFYLRQARNLGYYMNTGKSREKVALLNAYNIARVAGDPSVVVSDAAIANVEPIINMLATLHAINEANTEHVSQALAVLDREMAEDNTNNGITAVLMAHAGLKEQSEKQFSTTAEYKALAIKGWTKEVYKEKVSIEAATAREAAELEAQGYIRSFKIPNDPTDPVQDQRWLFVSPDGALAPYMSTIVSLTNNVAKGSNRKEVNKRWGADNPAQAGDVDVLAINRKKLNAIKEMNARPNGPTGESTENYMIPIVNPKGEIVDWRYMMTEANKDGILQKENNAAEVLGSMAGNVVDKVESAKVNKKAVAVLKDLYDKEYSERKNAYVEIGPNSSNERYREIWYQVPQAMRDEVNKVFGTDSLPIRADLVNSMFGYRKASISALFSKDPETRRWYERMVTDILTAFFGKKAARYALNTENFLQALTQEVKDVVIVKSGVVTVSNMMSNTMLLVMNGMTPIKALKYQYRAFINSTDMLKDVRKVRDLDAQLKTMTLNPTQRRQREAEIVRLRKRISQNPTYDAYSAGLMPTIVDDAAADTEFSNSTRGKAQRAVSKGIDKHLGFTPSWVRDGVKTVVGLPDTELYKFMNHMVMQSDFVARYAILEHWKDANNGKAKPEMYGEAEELFVNFDAPTHKGLQYMNDIGLAWFSKYALRVNRSIARTFAKNPISAAMAVLSVDMSGLNVDDPTDSSLFGGANPFRVLGDPLSKALDATDVTMIGQAIP